MDTPLELTKKCRDIRKINEEATLKKKKNKQNHNPKKLQRTVQKSIALSARTV